MCPPFLELSHLEIYFCGRNLIPRPPQHDYGVYNHSTDVTADRCISRSGVVKVVLDTLTADMVTDVIILCMLVDEGEQAGHVAGDSSVFGMLFWNRWKPGSGPGRGSG